MRGVAGTCERQDALEGLHVAALTPNKTGCPHQSLAQLPTVHQPKEAAEARCQRLRTHFTAVAEAPALTPGRCQACSKCPAQGRSKGCVGKCAWKSGRGWREGMEEWHRAGQVTNQHWARGACQPGALTPSQAARSPVEELLCELQVSVLSGSLLEQLLENRTQVAVGNNAPHDPKSFQKHQWWVVH